ncbi:MAG: site-specific integrase [Myxacorys chilensis ATA2-1-KO14]|jgi:integrase|nr:site-specific integrase [Myxacorys chilensis ATA2-1-KO14]
MKFGRYGQAKILTKDEIFQVLYHGLKRSRDRALAGLCLYTACRISEARQMLLRHAFDRDGNVQLDMVIPWQHTKGQKDTRVIPTHPELAVLLQQYQNEAHALFQLITLKGAWAHQSLAEGDKLRISDLRCPQCGSNWIHRAGTYTYREQSEPRYFCRACNYTIRERNIQTSFTNPSVEPSPSYDTYGVKNSANYGFLFVDSSNPYLFPGRDGQGCLSLRQSLNIMKEAFDEVGLIGASSHSWRRTSLTTMHRAGVPLRTIQMISGHRSLEALQGYLEVSEEEVRAAINTLK